MEVINMNMNPEENKEIENKKILNCIYLPIIKYNGKLRITGKYLQK